MKRKSGFILSLLAVIVATSMLSDVNAQTQEPFGSEPTIGYSVTRTDLGFDISLSSPVEIVLFSDYIQDDPGYTVSVVNSGPISMYPENLLFIKHNNVVTSMVYMRNNDSEVLVVNGVLRDYWIDGKMFRNTVTSLPFFSEDRYWRWGTGR